MHRPARTLRLGTALLTAAVAALTIAACDSSNPQDASTLLHQTFAGVHRVDSGNLNLSITVTPSGSSTLRSPITLRFGGPFQSRGSGKLPASDFNVNLSAVGSGGGSVGILSTGTKGYVTFEGSSYELPAADFQRLESSFSQLAPSASAAGGSAGSSLLGKLGIEPLHWLIDPHVVGTEDIAGIATTHIHAGINVAALLRDFSTFLERASSLGVSGAATLPHGLSEATRSKIAAEVQNPSFDVWTGNADKTVRRLEINLTLPVSGRTSTLLGGMRSAGIGLSLQYSDLNQPQAITAPTTVLPYSEFQSKLHAFEVGLESGVSGASSGASAGGLAGAGASGSVSSLGPGGSAGSTGAGGSTTAGARTSSLQAYSQCIQSANGDIAKMQRCAPLLNKK